MTLEGWTDASWLSSTGVMTGGNESWRVSPTSAVYIEPLYFNQSSQRYIVAWCLGHKAMMEMECNLWFLCR